MFFLHSQQSDWLAEVCILGGARTPFGSFLGSLAPLTATQLGATAIRGAGSQSLLICHTNTEAL